MKHKCKHHWKYLGREMMRDGNEPDSAPIVFLRYKCVRLGCNAEFLAYETENKAHDDAYWKNFEQGQRLVRGYAGSDEGVTVVFGNMPC